MSDPKPNRDHVVLKMVDGVLTMVCLSCGAGLVPTNKNVSALAVTGPAFASLHARCGVLQ